MDFEKKQCSCSRLSKPAILKNAPFSVVDRKNKKAAKGGSKTSERVPELELAARSSGEQITAPPPAATP
jgi:hypothetical protein